VCLQGWLSSFESHCAHHKAILTQLECARQQQQQQQQLGAAGAPAGGAAAAAQAAVQQVWDTFHAHAALYDALYEGKLQGQGQGQGQALSRLWRQLRESVGKSFDS
jgi:hypothetical protein